MTLQKSYTYCQVAFANTHARIRQIMWINIAFKLNSMIVKGSLIMLSKKSHEIEEHNHLPILYVELLTLLKINNCK
jgi:hypothetical protein